jgi:HlyD family secretion protein
MSTSKLTSISVLFLLFLSCGPKNDSITPEVKNITESVYASGIVKSTNQYEVYSKLGGIIEKITVKEGMHVKKGDTLFQLENKNSIIATENARLASENADFLANTDLLNEAENLIQLARKKLINDSLFYFRQKNLWDNKIGSKVELEQKELNFQNSKIALNNSIIRHQELERQLKLASNQSKNNLQLARLLEDDLIIRSEVDGVVYKINKEVGELVNNLGSIAVIGGDGFIIELSIDEFDITKIKPDQQVIIRMDSYLTQLFEAKITTIDPMINERTRSFNAEAVFTKEPAELYPNLTVEANIVIHTKQDVLTIPRNYLMNDSIVKLEDGTFQKVETGLMDYNLVEIIAGINANTNLVLPDK